MKIAIDAGHGLNTPGKRCLASIDPNETREWVLNSRVAGKLQNLLSAYDVEVIRVDDTTGATDVSLADRCGKANSENADLYISIHHNAGANGSPSGGLEVYRHPACSETGATAFWQKAIYDSLINAGLPKGNRSEPIKTADYYVLRNTKMIAILCEMGFMDSTSDTPLILTDEFADKAAKGLCDCLVANAGIQSAASVNSNNAPPAMATRTISAAGVSNAIDSGSNSTYAVYQVYTSSTKWLPNVVDDSDYAGVKGRAIQGLYVNLSQGSVIYQVHTVGGKWLPWVTDRNDYAGILGKNVDAVRIKLEDSSRYSVQCRVAPIGGDYYPWVTDNNDYAGVYGKVIDRIQIRIINK